MVMKSRVSENASGPSAGKFSTPMLNTGLGSCPAATARSRAAPAAAVLAASAGARFSARRNASARVSGALSPAAVASRAVSSASTSPRMAMVMQRAAHRRREADPQRSAQRRCFDIVLLPCFDVATLLPRLALEADDRQLASDVVSDEADLIAFLQRREPDGVGDAEHHGHSGHAEIPERAVAQRQRPAEPVHLAHFASADGGVVR